MSKADRFTLRDAPGGRAYSITCSECGERATLPPNTAAGTLPPQFITKKFQRRGWTVGSVPRKDKCPKCNGRHEDEEDEVKEAKIDKNLRVVSLRPVISLPETPKQEPAVPTLSREDRRIILAKLGETYEDETTGYKPGWSDEKVAKDLGIDVEWIQSLREENFGDLPVSAIDKSFLAEAEAILAKITEIRAEAGQILVRSEQLLIQAQAIASERKTLDAKLGDLLAQEQLLAEQIAKIAA